jgi:hypothetical protein
MTRSVDFVSCCVPKQNVIMVQLRFHFRFCRAIA